MDPDTALVVRRMREADGPVTFGLPPSPPVPDGFPARFGIKAVIGMALYPRVGKPWSFGLHQCSHARVWTASRGGTVPRDRPAARRRGDHAPGVPQSPRGIRAAAPGGPGLQRGPVGLEPRHQRGDVLARVQAAARLRGRRAPVGSGPVGHARPSRRSRADPGGSAGVSRQRRDAARPRVPHAPPRRLVALVLRARGVAARRAREAAADARLPSRHHRPQARRRGAPGARVVPREHGPHQPRHPGREPPRSAHGRRAGGVAVDLRLRSRVPGAPVRPRCAVVERAGGAGATRVSQPLGPAARRRDDRRIRASLPHAARGRRPRVLRPRLPAGGAGRHQPVRGAVDDCDGGLPARGSTVRLRPAPVFVRARLEPGRAAAVAGDRPPPRRRPHQPLRAAQSARQRGTAGRGAARGARGPLGSRSRHRPDDALVGVDAHLRHQPTSSAISRASMRSGARSSTPTIGRGQRMPWPKRCGAARATTSSTG